MTVAGIALPRILRIGGGASQQLAEVLGALGVSRPLVVTDAFLAGQGMVERLLDGLRAAGIAARVFTETVPDPTVASIEAGLAFLEGGDHDRVVGFGGGRPPRHDDEGRPAPVPSLSRAACRVLDTGLPSRIRAG